MKSKKSLIIILAVLTTSVIGVRAQSDLTGTYKHKSKSAENEINVQEIKGNQLRVSLYASYIYKVKGELTANNGEAKGIAPLKGDTAILAPADIKGCKITLKFSGNKIAVAQSESECGFGMNVSAEGIYTKVSGKPNFDDSDEDLNSNDDSSAKQTSKTERVQFAKGKSSAVVSGTITHGNEVIYLIGGRAGQTLDIKITDGGKNNDVVFSLLAPGGKNLMGDEESGDGYDTAWKGKLPKSGDYKIVVGTIESEKANFKMSVSIR